MYYVKIKKLNDIFIWVFNQFSVIVEKTSSKSTFFLTLNLRRGLFFIIFENKMDYLFLIEQNLPKKEFKS